MMSVKLDKRIQAPPQRVFEVFTNFAAAPEHVQSIKKLEILTPGPVGKGTRFRETRVMFGREATQEMEITDWQPGSSYSVGAEAHGTRYLVRYDFRPEGTGTTVEMEFRATPLSLFAKIMSVLGRFMMKGVTKTMDEEFEALKAVAERPA